MFIFTRLPALDDPCLGFHGLDHPGFREPSQGIQEEAGLAPSSIHLPSSNRRCQSQLDISEQITHPLSVSFRHEHHENNCVPVSGINLFYMGNSTLLAISRIGFVAGQALKQAWKEKKQREMPQPSIRRSREDLSEALGRCPLPAR